MNLQFTATLNCKQSNWTKHLPTLCIESGKASVICLSKVVNLVLQNVELVQSFPLSHLKTLRNLVIVQSENYSFARESMATARYSLDSTNWRCIKFNVLGVDEVKIIARCLQCSVSTYSYSVMNYCPKFQWKEEQKSNFRSWGLVSEPHFPRMYPY